MMIERTSRWHVRVRRTVPEKSVPRPNLFIVGAPKSGTTSLYDYLRQHSGVFMPEVKEPAYFGTDLHFEKRLCARDTIHHLNNYLRLFDKAGDVKCVGEGTTLYLYSRQAAREIIDFDPHARILIMLRNPVDMIYSLHGEWLWNCNEDIEDFEEALKAQEDRARGRRIPRTSSFPQGLQYYDIGRYSAQVARYFDAFPREQVLVLIFDDFAADTPAVYRQVLEFLELNTEFSPDFSVRNVSKPVGTLGINRFFAARPGLRRAINATIGITRRKQLVDMLAKIAGSRRRTAELSPGLRAQLQTLFLPDVEQLSELLNRDLTHWCRSAPALPDTAEVLQTPRANTGE